MNREEYKKPNYNTLEYTCLHCGQLVRHESISYDINTCPIFNRKSNNSLVDVWEFKDKQWTCRRKEHIIEYITDKTCDTLLNDKIACILFITRICSNCGGRTYWELVSRVPNDVSCEDMNFSFDLLIDEQPKLIYPIVSSIDIVASDDMSDEYKKIFNEARDVFDKSPRSSGALLRLLLEKIMREEFKDKHSKSLLGVIISDQNVKKELGENIITLCEACKLIGNGSVHSSLLICEDEQKNDVQLLFQLVNLIFKKIVVAKKEENYLLEKANEVNKRNK